MSSIAMDSEIATLELDLDDARERIKELERKLKTCERDYQAMYSIVKAYEDKYGPNA